MYNTFEEVARRYAKALFETASDLAELEDVATSMTELRAMFAASGDLQRLVRTPGIKPETHTDIFTVILQKMQAGDTLRKFVGLLCLRKRVFLIPAIIRHFDTMLKESRGEITATVTSAKELSADQAAALSAALQPFANQGADKSKGKVTVQHQVDPALIGGLKILLGPRLIDLSVRHCLEAIHRSLNEV